MIAPVTFKSSFEVDDFLNKYSPRKGIEELIDLSIELVWPAPEPVSYHRILGVRFHPGSRGIELYCSIVIPVSETILVIAPTDGEWGLFRLDDIGNLVHIPMVSIRWRVPKVSTPFHSRG